MFRQKIMCIIFLIFSTLMFADPLKILTPDGLPSLAVVNMMDVQELGGEKVEFKIEKVSDSLVVDMLKKEGDIAIVPSNFAGQLYNKNLGYKIAGTIGWGSFYVVTKEDIANIQDLNGKKVAIFGKGLTPDIVLQTILKENGVKNVEIEYLSNGNELASLYLAGKVKIAVVPEPMLSKIISKSPESKLVLNLNDLWKKLYGSTYGYPQSTLVIKDELYEKKPEVVKEFLGRLKDSILTLYLERGLTKEKIEKYGITMDTALLDEILKRAGIIFADADKSKDEYNKYFEILNEMNSKVIGGRVPDEKIYAR